MDTPDDCNHCPNGDIEDDYSQMEVDDDPQMEGDEK